MTDAVRRIGRVEWDDVPSIARRQDGVFTAAQAIEQGWSPGQVRRRRETGRWIPVAGRALRAAGPAEQPRALAWAAQLTWPDAVVCRSTAAGVHGFPVPAADAHALVRHGHRRLYRLRPTTVSFDAGPGVRIDGLRVTDRRGTALDCLAFLPFGDALDLYAWLTSRSELDRDDVVAATRWAQARWGVRQLRELLRVTRSGAVSAAEFLLHELLRAARITDWRAGATVRGASGTRWMVDLLFEAERVVLEVDGERAHAGRIAFVQDRRRQNDLVAAGFVVLRFTWWDLTERPESVIRQIRQIRSELLRRRTP